MNMEYEKKYKNALEWARQVMNGKIGFVRDEVQEIFPELAESENEKIRKELVQYLTKSKEIERAGSLHGNFDEWITWLEKKGEQSINDTNEEIVKAVKDTAILDMVESKLHKGEWIISNNGDCVGQIIDYGGDNFFWCEHTNGYFSGYFKKDYHLWTIEDAKPGDVLVNGSNIFIFHFLNDTRLMGYCHVNTNDGRFYDDIGKNECFCLIDAVVTPATKEQRDLLFQKMKEAGYEWDVEKKELKKIEQEDEEYNGDDYGIDSLYHAQRILEKTLGEVEGYQSDDGILEHKCAITAVKELYKKKPAKWSEEDERNMQNIDSVIFYDNSLPEDTCMRLRNWLKFVKQRVG